MATNLMDDWELQPKFQNDDSDKTSMKTSFNDNGAINRDIQESIAATPMEAEFHTESPATMNSAFSGAIEPEQKCEMKPFSGKSRTMTTAKVRLSKPRLTGLEGDDANEEAGGKNGKDKRNYASSSNSTYDSPLSRIFAATTKFNSIQQPKRMPMGFVFTDDFMDSLGELSPPAADEPEPVRKKSKIIRRKISIPAAEKVNQQPRLEQQSQSSAEKGTDSCQRRVRFCDEMGTDLVQTRYFEVEEGERVNVARDLNREQLKHFESQQEKLVLQQLRNNNGFSLTDPALMPPGHRLRPLSPVSDVPIKKEIAYFPWKLLEVEDAHIMIEAGKWSQARYIEQNRQKVVMEAILLPEISLPISDLEEPAQSPPISAEEPIKLIPLDYFV